MSGLAPAPGFEPGTSKLTAWRSAVELSGKVEIKLYHSGRWTSRYFLFERDDHVWGNV